MRATLGQPCSKCGQIVGAVPLCYGVEAPWRLLGVTEAEFSTRVDLTADQCVVDERHFFIRGHELLASVALEPTDHPLAIEQREGVSASRLREIADEILHADSDGARLKAVD